jgi:hypothetical protein
MRRLFIQILIFQVCLCIQLPVKAGTAYLPPIIDDPVKLNKEVERRVVRVIKLGDIAEQCITFSNLGPGLLGIPVPSNFVNPNAPSCKTYTEERPSIFGEFRALRKDQIEPYFKKNGNLKNKTETALAMINELDARLKVAISRSETSTLKIDEAKRINGAFGLVLGRVFSPSIDSVGTSSSTELRILKGWGNWLDLPMYEVKPEKPYRSFTKYYVRITPESRKIYSIWGIGSIEGNGACQGEEVVIIETIQSKYSGLSVETDVGAIVKKIFKQGNRMIIVEKCDQNPDYSSYASTIKINYVDSTLETLAKEEIERMEKKKLQQKVRESDSSGL